MREIGTYLKYMRIQKKITQEQLSNGICTPSYLSRIENNLISADVEIYTLLFEKLGLSYKEIIKENDALEQRLEDWYKHMFFYKESREDIQELKELCETARPNTAIMFEIVYCRYLILNHELEAAKDKIIEIKKLNLTSNNNRNYFLFINVLMLFYYARKEYQRAIEVGTREIDIKTLNTVAFDYEIGAYHYNLAINYKNMYMYDECNHHSGMALDIFRDGYYLEQAIDCHILLGISFNNLGKREESLDAYLKAKRLLNYLSDKYNNYYLGMIEHNIGYCYQRSGEYKKAIHSYENSLNHKKSNEKLLTLINLIQCYYSIGEKNISKKLLLQALELANTKTPKLQQLHLDFLRNILLEESLSKDQIRELEHIFIEFVNLKLQDAVIYYGEVLARILEGLHYYKKANNIYKTMVKAESELYEYAF